MLVTIKEDCLEKVDEKILLIAIIGSLEAVRKDAITLDEAEKFLFSPHMIKKLKSLKFSNEIMDLIMQGCELEDIVMLIPEKFLDIIEEMKQESLNLLKKYAEYRESFWLEE